jgi:hypothetical protein
VDGNAGRHGQFLGADGQVGVHGAPTAAACDRAVDPIVIGGLADGGLAADELEPAYFCDGVRNRLARWPFTTPWSFVLVALRARHHASPSAR